MELIEKENPEWSDLAKNLFCKAIKDNLLTGLSNQVGQ
jgi:hypothetical protein